LGQVSSGGYGYWVEKSLALAYVKAGAVPVGGAVSVSILGRPHRARRLPAPPFDPEGRRLRDLAPVVEPAE
jgi:dimethylglycine dehydrogenase